MHVVWGLVIAALGLIAWGGQSLAFFAPSTAVRLALAESEHEVEPAFYADSRGEALWDFFTLWTLLVAGVLLILNSPAWPYFGLSGGAIYVYFAGRGVLTRRELQERGFSIGSQQNATIAFTALLIWGVAGLVTVVASLSALA